MSSIWIWPFELLQKIGEGGMGVVYKARYVKDDRMFAVKLIPADVSNKTVIARFEREIEVLKTLRHPNIVRAFGGVCEDKQRFYAMELIEGGTLWDKIQNQGQLTWDKVTDWGQQMCAGLAYAHEKQIIHRDVKPNNFLITKNGQLKLSDFGLISVMSENKLTADGRTLGTVQYMSPEQIRGKPPLTPATDIYSLGCVFYEMLTGRPPFSGESVGPIMHAHLTEKPRPINEINHDCPASLERLIMSMLEKLPENRPSSAEEVGERLAEIRFSPRLIETPDSSTPIRVSQTETPPELKPVIQAAHALAEKSTAYLKFAGAGGLVIFSLVLLSTLFRSDPGTALWVETLKNHPETSVKIAAAQSIGQLANKNRKLLEKLMEFSEDTNADMTARAEAIKQLAKHGDQAKQYRPRINRLAKSDPAELIRLEAVSSLSAIGGE